MTQPTPAPTDEPTNQPTGQLIGQPDRIPTVLFVCVHNAGRSQMAAGYLQHLTGGRVQVLSAGSQPADQVNPMAVHAMAEEGIDIAAHTPKLLTDTDVQQADVVITMGCGDTCPYYPGRRYEDWVLPDPAGQDLDTVRPIRDEIRGRVSTLVEQLLPEHQAGDGDRHEGGAIGAAIRDAGSAAGLR